jgi:hypothetical protein
MMNLKGEIVNYVPQLLSQAQIRPSAINLANLVLKLFIWAQFYLWSYIAHWHA